MQLSLSVVLLLWFCVCTPCFVGSGMGRPFLLLFIFQKVDLFSLSIHLVVFFSTCPVVDLLTCQVVDLSLFLFSILCAFSDASVHAGKPCWKLVSNNFLPVLQV